MQVSPDALNELIIHVHGRQLGRCVLSLGDNLHLQEKHICNCEAGECYLSIIVFHPCAISYTIPVMTLET